MAAEHIERMGRNIQRLRLEKGLSQRALAELIPGKADGAQMSGWERGEHRPGDDTLAHIARILEVDVADLFAQEEEDAPAETPDLMEAFSPDGPAQLSRIEAAVTGLAEKFEAFRVAQVDADALDRRVADLRKDLAALVEEAAQAAAIEALARAAGTSAQAGRRPPGEEPGR